MVSVVVVVVLLVEAEVCRTRTVSPSLTVLADEIHAPLLMRYSLEAAPPTEIDAGELMPLTVIAFDMRV
jgi:hypothetical protein